ncbi:MAG: hypothetical protein GX994_07190 [Firmicutes bacterium]|nr:hypothetical protein [Bacillota bacterium]
MNISFNIFGKEKETVEFFVSQFSGISYLYKGYKIVATIVDGINIASNVVFSQAI